MANLASGILGSVIKGEDGSVYYGGYATRRDMAGFWQVTSPHRSLLEFVGRDRDKAIEVMIRIADRMARVRKEG